MTDVPGGADRRPVPDPTALTTEALAREVATLRDVIALQREVLEGRIDAEAHAHKITYDLARELVDTRLADHKEHAVARWKSSQREVELALSAQQEAVAKQERSTERTLDALQASFRTELAAIKERQDAAEAKTAETIVALTARVDRTEGARFGATQLWALIAGILTLLILAAGFYLTVVEPNGTPEAPAVPDAPAALVVPN